MYTTVYPTDIPTRTSLPVYADDVDDVKAAVVNDPVSELIATQTELGKLPKGSCADLTARLAVSLADDGSLKTTLSPTFAGLTVNSKVIETHTHYQYESVSFGQAAVLGSGVYLYRGPNQAYNLGANNAEANFWIAPRACAIVGFYVRLLTAPGGVLSAFFASFINGSVGNQSIQITTTSTAGNDTAHTDTLSAGDRVTIRFGQGVGGAAAGMSATLLIRYASETIT